MSIDTTPLGRFAHYDSIYSFMVIYPELERRKKGSNWSWHVWWAVILFSLNVLLQVSLTYVVGSSILQESGAFRAKLLGKYETDLGGSFESLYAGDEGGGDCCRTPWCKQGAQACCRPGERLPPDAEKNTSSVNVRTTSVSSFHDSTRIARRHLRRGEPVLAPGAEEAFLERKARKPGGKARAKQEGRFQEEDANADGLVTSALCHFSDGKLDCAQPSFAILDRWTQLDTDSDGIWTREEAQEDWYNLGCVMQKGVSLEQVFLGIATGMERHFAGLAGTWESPVPELPASVLARTAMPKFVFKLWAGVVVLCSARDVGRCGELVSDGVFNGGLEWPLHRQNGGFLHAVDALDFCQKVLDRRLRVCQDFHPVTYPLWSQLASEVCGAGRTTEAKRFQNPFLHDDFLDYTGFVYTNMKKYTLSSSGTFLLFMGAILFLWFLSLLGELNLIFHLADFTYNFAHTEGDPFSARKFFVSPAALPESPTMDVTPSSIGMERRRSVTEGSIVIEGISTSHRCICVAMVVIRTCLLCYMAAAGVAFLMTTFSYTDLLMNAVALAFVFELPEFLFLALVGNTPKKELYSLAPLVYKTSLPDRDPGFRGLLHSNNFWGLVLIPFVIFCLLKADRVFNADPTMEALQCACFGRGTRCLAADKLSASWWNSYWHELDFSD